ncbi:hypothetical protein BLL52_3212 [Rhodoferax antarcticus ANT.BR]|uniref:Uncharacterized protein n=1 Tax=Rhodoferax antarcticus ANT.BR TaxID=1111071 RepID=A0A1Q8YBX0_9BURK|nr:hypothetical protein BLL52_3212 [Rhodoferax antarcticus ANT.BR]
MHRRQSLRLVAAAHHRLLHSMLCSFSQWPMRSTAMASSHEAVA